ncbi:MAG: ABC transporter ATP-binding protein [Cellulomonas sp.]|jgi:ABC-type multidrug transport system ATPase subunit|nr:ABC transporter ATP-binding protein [Cellulomonas sp.]
MTAEPAPPGIQADDVHRTFGSVRAVDGATFTVPSGAVTALIGPNGSGKTTLLLILAGLLAASSGQVEVAGADPRHVTTRRRIGWMPDEFGTWDALTPTEILVTFAQAYGLAKAPARARAEALLDQLHLTELAAAPARVLSRGQKQRLGLARALVHDPDVLLLDEPASGLDPRSRIELRQTLRALADQGKTVLLSSHILAELEDVYDQAVFLDRGRTVVPDTSVTQASATTCGWRLAALDPGALRTFLDHAAIPWQPAPGDEVVVDLTDARSAADLLKAALAEGVPVHTLTPVAGRLEEAYLALDREESRR